ncbi:hypothetical protein [Microcoleus sp. D2_18a_D3]|uniref:hypothetical protein n=1 Tax=Microcoleus sp. D2_18a_D3 TaxID=3055330 RepID=UPI002FD36AA1
MHTATPPRAGMESSFLRIRLFNQDCPTSSRGSFPSRSPRLTHAAKSSIARSTQPTITI